MFKVNYKGIRKTRHCRRSGVFVNFEHTSHFARVFIVNFGQVNADWVNF